MIHIEIPETESWDEKKEEFVTTNPAVSVSLEHSLLSVSKWESRYCIPFLSNSGEMTDEQTKYYLQCMLVDESQDPSVISRIPAKELRRISEYINFRATATTFPQRTSTAGHPHELITSELIYYWIVAFNIDFCVESWNLNRLLTLIRICTVKQEKPKPRSRAEMAAERSRLNAERKARLNTTG